MTSTTNRRTREGEGSSGRWGVIIVSIAVHAMILFGVHVGVAPEFGAKAAPVELSFSCEADATLAFGARMALCTMPVTADRDRCQAEAQAAYEVDTLKCSAVEVAFADPSTVEPKPLLPVRPLDPAAADAKLAEEVAEKLEEQRQEQVNPAARGQVVEITKPTIEMRPDLAQFLSEFDSAVEKQTVARGSTEKMVESPAAKELPVQPGQEVTQPSPTETPPGTEGPKPAEPASSLLAMRDPGQAESPRLEPGIRDGFDALSENGFLPKRGEAAFSEQEPESSESSQPDEVGSGSGPSGVPDLRPTSDLLSRAVGGGSVDKLDGVESGDRTALNSRQWKFASFFNRMKRQVAQNWHPDQVYLRRDPTGRVYGTKDRLTVLRVSLHPDGRLAQAYIADKSGITFLDDEAVRAFQLAQPFPNPPPALIDHSSNLITFSFGFHFQIGDRSRWKVFRYR